MIADLWWAMFGFSALVVIAVTILWVYAWRRDVPAPSEDRARGLARRWIVGGGIVLPVLSITALLAFGLPAGLQQLPLPAEERPLDIVVTGHQWWWEVHYPSAGVTLRDTLHLPVGVPVHIHARTADVIHSFWVPRLGGKIDMIPGRTNVLRIQADEVGRFRGQCAEFCGSAHARMVLMVEAHRTDDFTTLLRALAP